MNYDPYTYLPFDDEEFLWDDRQQDVPLEFFDDDTPPFQQPFGRPPGGRPPFDQSPSFQPPFGRPRPPFGRPPGGRPPFDQTPPFQPPFGRPRPPFDWDGAQGIRRCMNRNTWITLRGGRSFWFYPTDIRRGSVVGFRYSRAGWVRESIDLDRIRDVDCRRF